MAHSKIRIMIVLVVVCGIVITTILALQPSSAPPETSIETVEQLDDFIASQVSTHEVPGAAVSIIANGDVVWSKGYGFANVAEARPVTPDTPFMIASISKAVTSVALIQAVEEGHFGLDDDINTLLPFEVNNPRIEGEAITPRHLVTHTSGIVDNEEVYNASYAPGDPQIALGDFTAGYFSPDGEWYDSQRNFADTQPGEQYAYSNVGAALAGYLLEATTGAPLNEFSKGHLFEPLGMNNTGWFLADFPDQDVIALPYDGKEPLEHYGYPTWPDGQLRSSVNDMGHFLAMVMNDGTWQGVQILQAETMNQMLEPQFPDIVKDDDEQALFWVYRSGLIGHTGGDYGTLTMMFFNPETKIGTVILMNEAGEQSQEAIVNILRQIALNEQTAALFVDG
ncbi:MAG: serine hydrolase [Chloroflexota bacterium]